MSNFPPQYSTPQFGGPPPKRSSSKTWILLGVGCLGLVVIIAGVLVAVVGGGWYMMTNSEAVSTAKTFVERHEEVTREFGGPVTSSLRSASFNTDNGRNTATIVLSIQGLKASGTATVTLASRGSTPWAVSRADIDGGPSGPRRIFEESGSIPKE